MFEIYEWFETGNGVSRQLVELGHPGAVSSALKLGGQKRLQGLDGHLVTDQAGADAEHVGVVVLTGQTGRGDVVHRGRTNAGDLVGRDGDADARAAHADAQFGLPGRDGPADRRPEVRVVATLLGVGPDVVHLVAEATQQLGEALLQFEPGVIGANGNTHGCIVRAQPGLGRAQQHGR